MNNNGGQEWRRVKRDFHILAFSCDIDKIPSEKAQISVRTIKNKNLMTGWLGAFVSYVIFFFCKKGKILSIIETAQN
jgi:hypothetical protein